MGSSPSSFTFNIQIYIRQNMDSARAQSTDISSLKNWVVFDNFQTDSTASSQTFQPKLKKKVSFSDSLSSSVSSDSSFEDNMRELREELFTPLPVLGWSSVVRGGAGKQ